MQNSKKAAARRVKYHFDLKNDGGSAECSRRRDAGLQPRLRPIEAEKPRKKKSRLTNFSPSINLWNKILFNIWINKTELFKKVHQNLFETKTYSQNAGLRPAMLAIAVSVRRGNFGKFVLSRFHEQFTIQLTITGQYSLHQTFQNVWRKNLVTFP